jgi:glycosyltransferase involved in cell wall biosynthesis
MNQQSYCGSSCLFSKLAPEAFPLSASARPEAAWVSGNRIVRMISDAGCATNHPLYSGRGEANRAERRSLLTVVMKCAPAHVAPVGTLCECAFEMPFVEGVPLRDFGLGPDANRLTHPQNRRPPWSPEALQGFLQQLASGLRELHRIGIAHGDPALMNALVAGAGATKEAIWIDLNSVRAATDTNVALDVSGFIELCLWPAMLDADLHSSALFADVLRAVKAEPDILAALSEILAGVRSDYQGGNARATFTALVREVDPLNREDLFGRIHRQVCACISPTYFLDQTLADQNTRFYRTILDAERTRHRIMEEEVTRLHHLQFRKELENTRDAVAKLQAWCEELESRKLALEGQAEERDRWIAELEKAKTWLAQQVDNWREAAGQQKERIAHLEDSAEERDSWIAELEKAKTGLAQQIDNWRATADQRSERIAALEETIIRMRATRAWRTAEWSVGLLRRLSGFCRGMILVGSPRLASSNAKNLLLGMKLVLGGGEGRATWGAHFDATYYKWANPDVARTGIPPRLHYLLCGYFENRNPSESFDSAYYRSRHLDVRDAGINPLLHYAMFGRHEERSQAPPLVPGAVKLPVPAPLEIPSRRWLFATETAPRTESTDGPLVSVVIPCFNYGQYVEQAIHSVLSQTFTNLEIIVVEGGSTDGTAPDVLRALEQSGLPRTRFVYRTESHLVGDNRNFGIGLARGRYVCCLDADDLIKPTYVEIAVFLAEFGGYDMVYPSVSCFEGSDFCWLLCDPTWPEIADSNQASTVAMFRKAAWERVGGFRDWGKGDRHVPEDWEFWVRLIGHGFRGKSIREPLMLYRVHHGGLWGTCELPVEQQRQAIREANPQLFVNRSLPATQSLARPVPSRDRLIEPAGSHLSILIALPFITIGGAEKLFATLARSLVGRGYKVVVITTLVLAKTIRDCTGSFEEVTPYLYPLPRLLQNQEECWADFLFYLLKRHGIGTILIAGCDFVYRLLPEIAREFPEIAVLDQLFNDEVHYPTNRHYSPYIDTTLVPSQALADKLISEAGEQADKVCVIPHGIDIEQMTAPDATFDSSGLPESFRGKFLVSFFGRLSAEKSPADFVEIARRLRSYDEIRFLMTGEGQERASVLALIEKSKLQDRIHVPGFVDNVRDLMALSDVVVVPSSVDGMPLVVFEAQAFSKPVVASAVGSIPHVIADGRTGFLCKPGNVKAFAARILELWRSPELCRAMGDAARIWVCANHSAESMTARYVKALDEARSRRQRGTSQPTSLAKEHPASLS